MTDITMGGGWGISYRTMSESVAARCAAADSAYEREHAQQERERAQRLAAYEDTRIRASIELALDRGEVVDLREAYRNGGVGRTPAEAIAYASARQDLEDARLRASARREIDQVGVVQFYADHSADTSVPHPAEIAGNADMLQRITERRSRRREIQKVARAVVRYDQMLGRTA